MPPGSACRNGPSRWLQTRQKQLSMYPQGCCYPAPIVWYCYRRTQRRLLNTSSVSKRESVIIPRFGHDNTATMATSVFRFLLFCCFVCGVLMAGDCDYTFTAQGGNTQSRTLHCHLTTSTPFNYNTVVRYTNPL